MRNALQGIRATGNDGVEQGTDETREQETRLRCASGSREDGWADRLRPVQRAPASSRIQISHPCHFESGDDRGSAPINRLRSFPTPTYYI